MAGRVERLSRRYMSRRWRQWLSDTSHLTHVSVLLFTTLSMVALVELGVLSRISFFVFPPLASASFTLFYDPESPYSQVRRVVIGLTLGAMAGWAAYQLYGFGGAAAGFALLLTGLLTWITSTEHASAFSASLLSVALRTQSPLYIVAVFLSTSMVATLFYLWKTRIYERRAAYLYESTWSDDRLLIPVVDDTDRSDIELAAKVADAHDSGRLVLLKIVGTEREPKPVEELETIAEELQDRHDIEVELAVLRLPRLEPGHILDAADRYDCDTIFVPWNGDTDNLDYLAGLLEADEDVIILSDRGMDVEAIDEVLIPIPESRQLSHTLVNLGLRIAGDAVSVSKLIGSEQERRQAERTVDAIIDGFDGRFETRVTNTSYDEADFISRECKGYDLLMLGYPEGTDFDAFVADRLEPIMAQTDIPVMVVETE